MSPFSLKRTLRSPGKHIAALLVCAFLAVMACYLSSYRADQQRKYDAARASAKVLCVVTDVTGTKSDNLYMGYGAYGAVTYGDHYRLPAYVKDPRMTKNFLFNESQSLIAVTRPECAEELDPERGGSVTLFNEGFYDSSELICLISEEAYKSLDGDTVSGIVRDPIADSRFLTGSGIEQVDLTVAGYYGGVGTAIYIPFETGMTLCDTVSNGRRIDSLSFLANDNLKLDELKEAASDVFGSVDPYADPGTRIFALTVHDEDLSTTLAAIEQNIRRTNWLIPIVFALTLGAGFLMGFITTRSEKQTYALQRSVGTKKGKLLRGVLAEQLFPPLLACTAAGAAFFAPFPALITFLLYSSGCLTSAARAASASPAQLLREQE